MASVGLLAGSTAYRLTQTPDLSDVGGSPVGVQGDPNAPRAVAYGKFATSGTYVFSDTYEENQKLGYMLAISDAGPIEGITEIRMNEKPVATDANSVVTTAPYTGKMVLDEHFEGRTDDQALQHLVQRSPFWTTEHRGRGVAKVFWELHWDEDVYGASGIPTPKFIGTGVKHYDPRKDDTKGGSGAHRVASREADNQPTWDHEGSGNPALGALHYILGVWQNGHRVWGLGVPEDLIDFDSFAYAAAICDTLVSGKKRYQCGGIVSAADDPRDVLNAFAVCMGGAIFQSGGRWTAMAGAPQAAVMTLTDDDLSGGIEEFTPTPAWRDKVNTTSVRFTDPDRDWQENQTAPITDQDYLDIDGGIELSEEFSALLCNDADCAHRIGRLRLANKREPRAVRATFKPRALRVLEGQTVMVDLQRLGLNEKMMVTARAMAPNGTVTLTLRTETDAKYGAADDFTQDLPDFDRLDRYDPTDVLVPDLNDWTITPITIENGASKIPGIAVEGRPPNALVKALIVEYRKADLPNWNQWPDTRTRPDVDTRTEISGVAPGADYQVRLRYRNAAGAVGLPSDVFALTTNDEHLVPEADDFTPGGTGDQRLTDLSELIAGLDDFSAEQIEDAISNADQNAANLIEAVLDRYERDKTNRAAIETERLTRISEDEAITQYTDSQLSVFNDSLAGVETEVTTVANDLEAFTQTTTTQFSVYDGNIAALETETTTLATDLQAEVTARTTAVAAVEDSVASLDQQVTLIANDQSAQASDISVLQAQYDDLSLNKASVTYVDQVVSDAESAFATSIQSVQADVDGLSADVTVNATAIATLEGRTAAYLVKVGVTGGGIAKFGLFSESGQASTILLDANYVAFDEDAYGMIDRRSNKYQLRFRYQSFQDAIRIGVDNSGASPSPFIDVFNPSGQQIFGLNGVTLTGTPQITNAGTAETMAALTVNNTWTEVQDCAVTVVAGSKVMVQCGLRIAAANWLTIGVAVEGRIKRDGTVIWTGEIASHPGFEEVVVYENGSPSADSRVRIPGRIDGLFSFFDLDTPPAGATDYTLECRTTAGSLTISERRMVAMEFRK